MRQSATRVFLERSFHLIAVEALPYRQLNLSEMAVVFFEGGGTN